MKLLNILAEETLENKWAPKEGTREHKIIERIYAAGALKAWSRMLRDVIAAVLKLFDEDEREYSFGEYMKKTGNLSEDE